MGEDNERLGESPAIAVTGKIMVVAIIILFFVVVVVVFLHLYAKCFWRRMEETTAPRPRNRRRRRFVFAPGQDPAIHGSQRRGLEPTILRSLPILVFQAEDFKDGLECAVCLSDLVQGEKARLLPKCNHGFHVDCIDMWFQSHSTCPLCRNPVSSESAKSSSSAVRENANENNQSPALENSDATTASESPTFPTNVLIWGNQTQVSSIGGISRDEEISSSNLPCPSSSASSSSTICCTTSTSNRPQGTLVIDIPCEINSSASSPSAGRFAEDDLKSPMTTRLRSLKRLLSRNKMPSPCSPTAGDVEQG